MIRVFTCIAEQHDLALVWLAVMLCIVACAGVVTMLARARAARGPVRMRWLATAAFVAGCGIWATHFIAMLAYEAGVPVAYDPLLTLLSIVIAIVLCGAGFALAFGGAGPLMGGVVVGCAISAMHYVGMAAVRAPALAVWNYHYVAASFALGVVLSAAALGTMLAGRGMGRAMAGGLLLAAGICAMHFTGMTAVHFLPDPAVAPPRTAIAPEALAAAVAAVAIVIVALGIFAALVDHRLALRAMRETARLRAYVAELEETRSRLETATRDLSEANAAKTRFLAAMSHELRTPLNAIIGFSGMMEGETFGPLGHPRYREYMKDIRESGAHLLSLINDILDLSRLDEGRAVLQEEIFDLGHIVAEAMSMVEPQAQAGGIALVETVAPGLPRLKADRRRVRQVILNLLSNAVKFTPRGGRVETRAFLQDGALAVCVSDTGIGIAPDDIPRALERFGQVDSTLARKHNGAGLGLPLARQLMECHEGSLMLESVAGRGTTVTAIFPASRLVAPAAAA